MNNIIRFLNQNRKGIKMIIIIIASLIILLQLVNYFVGKNNDKELEEANNNQEIDETELGTEDVSVKSTKSAVSGQTLSKTKLETEVGLITEFLENCNNGKIETAYNMLTEECKEEMYSSVDEFKIYYYGEIIKEARVSFDIENWKNKTYRVNIVSDMLATGKSTDGLLTQDYITVKDGKLNINNYIGRTKINKSKEQSDVKFTVNYKDVYKDYEKYNITVENNSNKLITLDDLDSLDTLYLEDENGMKYKAYTNEILEDNLTINPRSTKDVSIRYYGGLGSTDKINKIVFLDFNNGSYNNNRETVEIGI